VWGAASVLLASVLSLAINAAPAAAAEGVTSFRTTLVEASAFGESSKVFYGVVNSSPTGEGFTIETRSGGTDTIVVFPATKISGHGFEEIGVTSIASGEPVAVIGALSGGPGGIVNAARIFVEPKPGEVEIPPVDLVTEGVVQGQPSGESFTIETSHGATDTVEVSPSTTYSRARPVPGIPQPTLSDVRNADFVGVSGSIAGTTVKARSVVIATPQAGGHPNLKTSFALENPGAPEAAKNVIFNAPTGVFGNPRAITQCLLSDFALDQCPPNSQAGLITVRADYRDNPAYLLGTAPLFMIAPEEDETARFSFIVPTLNIPISIPVTVRTTTDYGLRFIVSDITEVTPLSEAKLTFWGFPTEKIHDAERFPIGSPGNPTGCPGEEGTRCITNPTSASVVPQPLIDNPTVCTGQEPVSLLEVQTYGDPTHPSEGRATYPPIEGCQREVFKPVLRANPTTNETDSASGLNIDLSSPQFLTFAAEPSELKAATVTLPEGFTINPDAADGQTACSDAQANFNSEGPAECPNQSKIGTFSIGTPALPERLEGSAYIGEPQPGNQYRLFLTASGFGMNIKLVGSFKPDPETGQLTAEFPNLPQAPFEDFQLHLFSGERALMATPTGCTIFTTKGEFYPWNATLAEQESAQVFGLVSGPHGSECPGPVRPFEPSLEAGTSNATAGAFSSFALKLNREDGDQFLGKLNFTMPPGLTANLHGVTYCPEADIRAAAETLGRTEQKEPSCPASSEIGSSNVAAGPGSHPFHAVGKIYMAGPFQGAPLSLVAITPALAGPYDYGTVVVRVALHIDPLDAHVIADSETVPEIIGGIPIRMREIEVNINKPNFMINPTNCSEFHTVSEGIGDQGTAVAFSSPFIAVNCATLPFSPKLTITQLGGRKATKQGHEPSLRFDLNTTPGDANVKSVAVTLPKAFEIDQEHLGNICDRTELAKDQCKGKTPIGTVIDETPLLEKPLAGPAYAVSGYGGLPHVVFILGGQVTVMPQGESTEIAAGLKTVIPTVPDVPIGHFALTLYGGSTGYLANTRSLCSSPAVSKVEIEGQNGSSVSENVAAKTACKAKHKPKRHAQKHHRARR